MSDLAAPYATTGRKTVLVPSYDDHEGLWSMSVTVAWVCPVCGGPRGRVTRGLSYDGSRRLDCDTWTNPCGHVDSYRAIRQEARS